MCRTLDSLRMAPSGRMTIWVAPRLKARSPRRPRILSASFLKFVAESNSSSGGRPMARGSRVFAMRTLMSS
ncbi:MAG TPA: hypothetical protein DD417_14345 [Elusimicrobia bacterium]|nr:hypothetical protein [Elusimicrobiota bacterium]